MNSLGSLRSTERSFKLISLGRRCLSNRTNNQSDYKCRISKTQYGLSRFSLKAPKIRLGKPKLFSTDTLKLSLINPNKPGPDENLVLKPVVPLTMSRFPDKKIDLPSVTKVLSATMPAASKYILDRWKETMLKKLGPAGFAQYQKDTFERGRALHALLANYLLGHGEPTPETEITAKLWNSIKKVVVEKISNVRLVEHIVTHSDMKYRGIVDCVACYEDQLVVIDFKTAEKAKKSIESLYDNPLQVTAYCGAINNDKSIPSHVIDRNICSGLVIVAYIDGSEASTYFLDKEEINNNYWKQWTSRLDQYTKLEQLAKIESGKKV